jgi:hypothetical protein
MPKKITEPRKCPECGRETMRMKKGLCPKCYAKHRIKIEKIGICLICNKEKNIHCKGMCHPCYDKERLKKIAESKPKKEIIEKSHICIKCGIISDTIIKNMCRKCYNQNNYIKNIEKVKKQHKQYREDNPEYTHQYYYEHGGGKEAEAKKNYKLEHKKEIEMERSKQKKEKCKIYKQTPGAKFALYKYNAKVGKIPFKLTFEEFMTFWQQPCYYTGILIETIGIDRVDNNKGYTMDNCVSCNEDINKMKLKMNKNRFINLCIKITNRFNIESYTLVSENTKINKEDTSKYRKTINSVYHAYKQSARRRNLIFELTKQDFKNFWGKPCFYSGEPVEKAGLDRIDNSKGYTINNVVSCNKDVNKMKRNLSKEYFLKLCKMVAKKFGTKITINKEI